MVISHIIIWCSWYLPGSSTPGQWSLHILASCVVDTNVENDDSQLRINYYITCYLGDTAVKKRHEWHFCIAPVCSTHNLASCPTAQKKLQSQIPKLWIMPVWIMVVLCNHKQDNKHINISMISYKHAEHRKISLKIFVKSFRHLWFKY